MKDNSNKSSVNLFFDESGKDKDAIKTMGGLLIPEKIYDAQEFLGLNERLRKSKFKLHWTEYNGGNSEKLLYKEIVNIFSKYANLCYFNVIYYEYPSGMNKEKFDIMIYSKIPERVLYGLLRFKGQNIKLEANLFIEEANVYKNKLELHNVLRRELNNNALYRGENFKINKLDYKKKNEEIGIELTDLFLGIIRVIIQNKHDITSKRILNKNKLIVELLKNDKFYNFLRNIKYFEWNNSYDLKKVEFESYINSFLANQNEWIEYLSLK